MILEFLVTLSGSAQVAFNARRELSLTLQIKVVWSCPSETIDLFDVYINNILRSVALPVYVKLLNNCIMHKTEISVFNIYG